MGDDKIFLISVKGILLKDNKILILKRPDYIKSRGGTWEFPGGGVNFGESLEEALKREVHEETCLPIRVDRPIYTWSIIKDENKQVIGIQFLCSLIDNEQIVLSDEHCDYAWVSVDEFKKYPMSPCIVDDLENNNLKAIIDEYINETT